MKRLPDITDEKSMLERGRRSALGSARNDAAECLRDACTMCQSADWSALMTHAEHAKEAADRLITLAVMWDGLNEKQE